MMRRAHLWLGLWAVVLGAGAHWAFAQSSAPGGVSQDQITSQINAATASIMAIMPTPLGSVPLGPNGAGVTGSGLGYVPGNAAQKQTVQRTNSSTDATGAWSVTWNTSFVSATPAVAVNALNANASTSGAVVCNVIARNATTASGKCFQTNVALVSLLGISITVAPTIPTTGMSIMVVGAEPTQ